MALFTGHTITPDSALGGIQLERSLRFDDNQSSPTRLTRTIQSGGNRKKFTLSVWVKRSQLGNTSYSNSSGNDGQTILHTAGNSNRGWIKFNSDDTLAFDQGDDSQGRGLIDTVAVYRDVTSWYHLVFVADYANSTAADRAKIYVNGVRQEVTTTRSFLQDTDGEINANDIHEIGFSEYGQGYTGSSWWFEFFCGYMAEYHFVDGQSYDPTYFAFTDAQTGQWRPKKYEGTHGTTGWYLPFTDNSSTSALGKDNSGNANDWTVNGFSVSAGADNDSLLDNPTNNFATFNTLVRSNNTFEDGGLKVVCSSSTPAAFHSTLGASSGKYYMEFLLKSVTNYPIGVSGSTYHPTYYSNSDQIGFWVQSDKTQVFRNGSDITANSEVVGNFQTGVEGTSTSWSVDDIAGLALDMDKKLIYLYKGSTQVGYVDFSGFGWETVFFGGGNYISGQVYIGNFGQRPFAHTPPTGYRSLCSRNLATPVPPKMIRPQRHFDTLTYTGNGSTQSISGLEFAPDFVWIKERSSTSSHALGDTVRGALKVLQADITDAEVTTSTNFTSFDSNGFTHGNGGRVNQNSQTYVAWCWKAGGTAVTNNDGSITSSVSANVEAGFSIVSWTGTGSDGTIGHGLGAVPSIYFVKRRNSSKSWYVQIGNLDGISLGRFLKLESSTTIDFASDVFAASADTSTVLNTKSDTATNGSGDTYIAYCWTDIPGYSKFGSYDGNGNSDGTYVHLGFRPAWLMIKNTATSTWWFIYDVKRETYNPMRNIFGANVNDAEYFDNAYKIDILSHGFKARGTQPEINKNGDTIIYMAFAEQPSGTMFGLDANAR